MSDVSWISDLDEIAVDIDLETHPVHNDPQAEIIIISNDYVKFRASRYHLVRTSQLFEDLLDTARTVDINLNDIEEPIHLNFPSSTISLFLDLAGVCDPYFADVPITKARSLLDVVEYTMCDRLIDIARSTLMHAAKDEPFELLVIASERDDLDLAKHALRNISTSAFEDEYKEGRSFRVGTVYNIDSIKKYLLRLTPSYHLAILHSIVYLGEMQSIDHDGRWLNSRPAILSTDNWSSIADTFNPAQFWKA
ncbi:hypothetical protein I203_106181 [Kwoniella mangroviensis CBS 8507]|uniref:uncharacterized protein n=1 Tax=Kwoniella mangroviensis CBS 8507 TaxID=1296122 RepID=UPI00080D01A2|nr:uncharacterized protein I203_04657 [Kwoniella mangroviensis CBS 8507]OCF66326.1 hypothetical protein I203_04657 [Kwoniella mangroviensis CBS 8507]